MSYKCSKEVIPVTFYVENTCACYEFMRYQSNVMYKFRMFTIDLDIDNN